MTQYVYTSYPMIFEGRDNYMKKILFPLCLILIVLSLFVYTQNRKMDSVKITVGKSIKFSENEINDAINCIKNKFRDDFKGCKLTELWYDEKESNSLIEGYLTNGKGSVNGVKAENVIALKCNFYVGSLGGDGSLNSNSTYSNFSWTLIRDSKTGNWKVDEYGY